jgi:hypothetical protein
VPSSYSELIFVEKTPNGPGGMDVAVFANGQIRTLYTFIETPVAAET